MFTSYPSEKVYREPYDVIVACIERELYPFRPGLVVVEVTQQYDLLYAIRVSCDLFKDPVVIDGRALYAIPYEEIPRWIGFEAGRYFNSREESVPDNVVLGDN